MKLQVGVKALIQNKDGNYLFLRRSQSFNDEAEPHWDIPGGRIEPEEALTTALEREILEETGLTIDADVKLVAAQDIFVPAAELHVVRLTYIAKGSGDAALSHEHQDTKWMSPGEALATNIDPYTREVLLILNP